LKHFKPSFLPKRGKAFLPKTTSSCCMQTNASMPEASRLEWPKGKGCSQLCEAMWNCEAEQDKVDLTEAHFAETGRGGACRTAPHSGLGPDSTHSNINPASAGLSRVTSVLFIYLSIAPLTLLGRPRTWAPPAGHNQQSTKFCDPCGVVSDVHPAQSSASRHNAQHTCQLLACTGIFLKGLPLYV
jgi:hypothetical protein